MLPLHKQVTGATHILQLSILIGVFTLFTTQVMGGKTTSNMNLIQPGMEISQMEVTIGPAEKVKEVERHIFENWGEVVVHEEKIDDIRFRGVNENVTPLWKGLHSNPPEDVNKLRYLRIGTSAKNIEENAGVPNRIEKGTDYYYYKGTVVVETDNNIVKHVIKNRETGLPRLDWVKLNFSSGSLFIMNITIAFIMFGVALGIKPESFKQIFKEPKSLIIGIFSQFLALPALTFVLIYFIQPTPTVALGMILVAACPGGNVSNFLSAMAKGNVALSISLTAFSTVVAVFMTPVNFAFWGKLYSATSNMVIPIEIDFLEILRTVMLLLGLPVLLGLWFSKSLPALTTKIIKPIKKISMVIFLAFIVLAFLGNIDFFTSYIHLIMFIVLAHNALALLTGFFLGTLGRVSRMDRRSITIETGIQNSGLGLVLIFNPRLFDGLGGMAFIAAWWGIWHIVSGMLLAWLWAKKPLPNEELSTQKVNSKS